MNEYLKSKRYLITFIGEYAIFLFAFIFACSGFILALPYTTSLKAIIGTDQGSVNGIGEYGQIGDYFGGVVATLFSFSGFLFVVATFLQQRNANNKQLFEGKFMEMLKIHRENVNALKKRDSEGVSVFRELYKDIEYVIEVIKSNQEEGYLLSEKEILEIAYLVVFFGVGRTASAQLKRILATKCRYKISFVERLISKLEEEQGSIKDPRKKDWILQKTEESGGMYWIPYHGNQTLISHYYRHLFLTIKFIDQQAYLNEGEKYFYAKIIRAQLSSYEIVMLYINSLSILGRKWELDDDEGRKNRFFTKYNFIKNIPLGIKLVSPKNYYPNVVYELDDDI